MGSPRQRIVLHCERGRLWAGRFAAQNASREFRLLIAICLDQ
jgi:hypothetical protein